MDYNDRLYIGENINNSQDHYTHYRIVSNEYKTMDKLEAALSSGFTKPVYKEFFDTYYTIVDGKLYCMPEVGDGGDWTATKVQIEMLSANNSVCKFRINVIIRMRKLKWDMVVSIHLSAVTQNIPCIKSTANGRYIRIGSSATSRFIMIKLFGLTKCFGLREQSLY